MVAEGLAGLNTHHLFPIHRIHHRDVVGKDRPLARHITDAQTIQRRKSIRPQLDTGADFTDFMRLLQQHHFDPLARQRERRRRAANAAADDNCSRHFRHTLSSLGRNFVLLIFRRGGDKRR